MKIDIKYVAVAATLMVGTMSLAFAQGTSEGAGGGLGTGSSQTGGTAAPGIGQNPVPSGTLPGLNNSTQDLSPCTGAATEVGCDPTGPGTGTTSEIPRQ
jgi:hypothetical protein